MRELPQLGGEWMESRKEIGDFRIEGRVFSLPVLMQSTPSTTRSGEGVKSGLPSPKSEGLGGDGWMDGRGGEERRRPSIHHHSLT